VANAYPPPPADSRIECVGGPLDGDWEPYKSYLFVYETRLLVGFVFGTEDYAPETLKPPRREHTYALIHVHGQRLYKWQGAIECRSVTGRTPTVWEDET
jgi:hypothetical protein